MSALKAIHIEELKKLLDKGINLLDFRPAEEFCEGLIPESLFVPDAWLSHRKLQQLLQKGQGVVIVAEDDKQAKEYAEKLKSIEIGPIIGYLEGGYASWQAAGEPIDVVISVEPFEMATTIRFEQPHLVDVRFSEKKYNESHLPGAEYVPAEEVLDRYTELQDDHTVYVYCEDGEGSLAVISFLKKHGLHHFYHVQGGFQAVKAEGIPLESTDKKKKGSEQDMN